MDTREYDPHNPTELSEMAGGESGWARFATLVRENTHHHLLLVGDPGVGKSCATRLLLGDSVGLWILCSKDTTLKDSRERIKNVARQKIVEGQIQWIVLEHADTLHDDAQAFLRRIIETARPQTRFMLEVRDSAAVSEPLLSRTVMVVAPKLLPYEIRTEIMRRNPALSKDHADTIAHSCEGNVRWAILQGLANNIDVGSQAAIVDNPKTWEDVLRTMEMIQTNGINPRTCLNSSIVWDRPGGINEWAVLAKELMDQYLV